MHIFPLFFTGPSPQAPSHHEISSELLSKPATALVHLSDGSTVQLGFSCTTLVRESLTTLAEDLGLELDDTFALYVQFEVGKMGSRPLKSRVT